MGGAVSSGRDNGELIDNLKSGNYIRTPRVEAVFRAVDRGDYLPPSARNVAYRDLAWKDGQLHLSAPCIYSEVLEALELREGLSFLNVGSGTGYLSTMAGLLLGSRGINHGIEIHESVIQYATKKLAEFLSGSSAVDEYDFSTPIFIHGNGLCLPPDTMRYDRVYCGAACPNEFFVYCKHLINVGGVLVMPLNETLVQVRRLSETEWTVRNLLRVSFASLLVPSKDTVKPPQLSVSPSSLQVLSRSVIRAGVRAEVFARHPHLREPPQRPPAPKRKCPRRICIPIEDDSDLELNELHDLHERGSGAAEMNALLSLVLSMGQSRAAGTLRLHTDTSSDEDSSDSSHSTVRPVEGEAEAERQSASVERQSPSVDSQSPSVDRQSPSVDRQSPSVDRQSPSVENQSASTERRSASVDRRSASVERQSASVDQSGSVERETDDSDLQSIPLDETPPPGEDTDEGEGSSTVSTPQQTGGEAGAGWSSQGRSHKRMKLDSGLGESSPDPRAHRSPTRHLHKRRHHSRSSSSSSSSLESERPPSSRRAPPPRRPPSPAARRRHHISRLMSAAIAALPLPPPLRLYINFDRPLPQTVC